MKRRSFLGGMLATLAAAVLPGCSKPKTPAAKPSPARALPPNQVRASTYEPWWPPVHPNCRCMPLVEGPVESIDNIYFYPYRDAVTGEMGFETPDGDRVIMREGEMVRMPNGSYVSWHSGGRA